MGELIERSFISYIVMAGFTGLWCGLAIFGVFRKSKSIQNKKVKILLRAGISSVLIGLWMWFIIQVHVYPISLAYYEYYNDITTEKIGKLENVEPVRNDRVSITVDGTTYMIAGRGYPLPNKGDTVIVVVGENSGYVFDIRKASEGE